MSDSCSLFCGEIQKLKINFKNCLLVIGRSLEKLLLSTNDGIMNYLTNMLESISRVRQKIRPSRHTPRQSRKPVNKWRSSNSGPVVHAWLIAIASTGPLLGAFVFWCGFIRVSKVTPHALPSMNTI